MRKIKLQMQMTVDGFVAGPNGELDWTLFNWDDALSNYVIALTEPVDCILMGRVLAQGFIPHWTSALENPQAGEDAFALKMVETPKVVFSRTLESVEWAHTRLAAQVLAEEVMQIKQQPGKDIIVYGGAGFVSGLVEANLIDEYHLFVNPTAIGNGLRIFTGPTPLKLVRSQAFDCGIVVNQYAPAG